MSAPDTFEHIWEELTSRDPEKILFRVSEAGESRGTTYRTEPVFRRVRRYARAFRNEIRLPAGSRVLLFQNAWQDNPLVAHGLWCAGLCPVIADPRVPVEVLSKFARECNLEAVVFPTTASAQVASLHASLSEVKSWILEGSSRIYAGLPGVIRLEEMVTAVGDGPMEFPGENSGMNESLILIVPGEAGNYEAPVFTQQSLIMAGKASAALFPAIDGVSGLSWCSLPELSVASVMFSLITPLFSNHAALLGTELEERKFWDQTRSDGITCAVIDQSILRKIMRKGKSRTWSRNEEFFVLLSAKERLHYELLDNFEATFRSHIHPFLDVNEAGGLVLGTHYTDNPQDIDDPVWSFGYTIPSAGRPLPGVDIEIVDAQEEIVEQGQAGQLTIHSEFAPKRFVSGFDYAGKEKGNRIFTGFQGFTVQEEEKTQVFIAGHRKDYVLRESKPINLARVENVLQSLRGVDVAIVVDFDNDFVGKEVGVYVIGLAAARLQEAQLMTLARRELGYEESPKVVIIGARDALLKKPNRESVRELFEPYRHIDYSRIE